MVSATVMTAMVVVDSRSRHGTTAGAGVAVVVVVAGKWVLGRGLVLLIIAGEAASVEQLLESLHLVALFDTERGQRHGREVGEGCLGKGRRPPALGGDVHHVLGFDLVLMG